MNRLIETRGLLKTVFVAVTVLLTGSPGWSQTDLLNPPAVAATACDFVVATGTTCQVTDGTATARAQFGHNRASGAALMPGFNAVVDAGFNVSGGTESDVFAYIPFRVKNADGGALIDLTFSTGSQTIGYGSSTSWVVQVGTVIQPLIVVPGTGVVSTVGRSGPLIGGMSFGGVPVPLYQWSGGEVQQANGNCGGNFTFINYFENKIPEIQEQSSSDCSLGDQKISFQIFASSLVPQYVVAITANAYGGGSDGASFTVVDPVLSVDPSNPDVILEVDAPVGSDQSPLTPDDVAWLTAYGFDLNRLTKVGIKLPSTDTTPPVTTASASPGPNANGWNNSNVAVILTATDSGGPGLQAINFVLSGAQNGSGSISGATGTIPITAEGVTTLTYFAQDTAGNKESPKTLAVRIDKTPPTITAALTPNPNANGWNNTDVTVQFSATDALSGVASVSSPVTLSNEGKGQLVMGTATDHAGNTAGLNVTVNIDKTPPVISGLPASGCTLWPPNHQLIHVANVSAADALSGIAPGSFLVTGASNEAADASGSGNTAPDIVINGGNVELRAERSGGGNGRVYTVDATATDLAGNVAIASGSCVVPHDQGKGN